MKLKKVKHPKDLGIKIVSENEEFWTRIKNGCEGAIKNLSGELRIQTEILGLANAKLEAEKEKDKKKANVDYIA